MNTNSPLAHVYRLFSSALAALLLTLSATLSAEPSPSDNLNIANNQEKLEVVSDGTSNDCLSDDCIESHRWHLGLALGVGHRTNPLVSARNVPLYAIPSIAYYGERFYFDNGDLGYTLQDNDRFAVNLTTFYNNDRGFFSRSDPSNIFAVSADSTFATNRDLSPVPEIEYESRRLSIFAGAEALWFSDYGTFSFTAGYDLLAIHHGSEVRAQWSRAWQYGNWSANLSAGFVWKSAEVISYYYGLRASEAVHFDNSNFNAKSGTNKNVRLSLSYRINQHWRLLAIGGYSDLANEIVASPILIENHSKTVFVGGAYQF